VAWQPGVSRSAASRVFLLTGNAVEPIADLVARARAGDFAAYGRLVSLTQPMAYAAAKGVLRDPALAEDATQDAYLRAYRRLRDLDEPAAFAGWLRRIVVTAALNLRRARRRTFLRLDEVADVPVLDERETRWSEAQRQRLSGALLTLSVEERRVCDRRYHGGWSAARLALDAGIDESAMRKRLQRIRDKLRKEIEMAEQQSVGPDELLQDMPAKVVELLARPKLTDLPENPVGSVLELLRASYPEFDERPLPELVDFADARTSIGDDALYLDAGELHRVDDRRILRYDLTLPMLLSVRFTGQPIRAFAEGKTYRVCQADATHLEAFHQAEVLWMDERAHLDRWIATARILRSVEAMFGGRQVKIVPTQFPMCAQAWELEVEDDGRWIEAIAWGEFTDRVVGHLGGDPARHVAIGIGHGLERLAMLRYRIDDIRKVEGARVA
jgi:RNA polymerase sigma factor (sigma-70 family)